MKRYLIILSILLLTGTSIVLILAISNDKPKSQANEDKAHITISASPTKEVTHPVNESPASNGWHVNRTVSPMDDSKILILSVSADRPITVWGNKEYTPQLVIRCKEYKISLFVLTGSPPEPEYGKYNEVTVRYRLDKKPPEHDIWGVSTDKKGLVISDSALTLAMILRMSDVNVKTFTFEFTPFHSSPVTSTFKMEGLNDYYDEFMKACPVDKLD